MLKERRSGADPPRYIIIMLCLALRAPRSALRASRSALRAAPFFALRAFFVLFWPILRIFPKKVTSGLKNPKFDF